MRNKVKVIFLCLCFFSFFVNASQVDKEIKYSTNPQYPPYDWAISKNIFEGASIDLLKLIFPPEYKLEALTYPWLRSQNLAKTGEIDVLLSLRITDERKEYLEFTKHRAFPNPIVVFVRKDSKIKFSKWDDLKKYKGGVSLGDTFGNGFDEYWPKELNIEKSPDMVANFQKLVNKRIDYFVTGYYLGMAYISANDLKGTVISLEKSISNMDIYIGFSKKSDKLNLIEYVSDKLEELDNKGVLEELLKKNLEKYGKNPKIYEP